MKKATLLILLRDKRVFLPIPLWNILLYCILCTRCAYCTVSPQLLHVIIRRIRPSKSYGSVISLDAACLTQ